MKKGFTLIELLAVVAVLGILGLVVVPIAMSYVDESRYSAFETGVKNVFDSAKIYIASYEENADLPVGGLSIDELKNTLKDSNYSSGVVYRNKEGSIYVENISDGRYCASGTKNDLKIIKGSCENLDVTPPSVNLVINNVTSTTATIAVNAADNQSGIYGYSYSIDGINYTEISNEKIYVATNLNSNQNTTIYVRVYNNKYDPNLSEDNSKYESMIESSLTEANITVKTLAIDKPVFKISTSESSSSTIKILDIIYPTKETGYKYTYVINGLEEVEVASENPRLTIDENCIITAKIYYNANVITNEIEISGIDNEGPVANIAYDTNWSTSKKVTIEVLEEVTGLPEMPYSFDGGNTWQAENSKLYYYNSQLENKILVRDVLGNITNKFTVNGEEGEVIINYVDTVAPTCEIKVTGDNNGTAWYTGDVTFELVNLEDTAVHCTNGINCNPATPGSGIKSSSITETSWTSNTSTTGKKIVGTVVDNVGNTGTCSVTVKIDKIKPSLTIKTNPLKMPYTSGYAFQNNLGISMGPSGQTVVCSPATNQQQASYNVTCTATAANGYSDTKTFNVIHWYDATVIDNSYAATETDASYTATGTDYEKCDTITYIGKTITDSNGQVWYYHKSGSNGCWVNCNTSSLSGCLGLSANMSGKNYCCTRTNYTCPSGGTLSGTTCKKTSYTCPNGGTLSGTTCVAKTYTCPNGGTLNGTVCYY